VTNHFTLSNGNPSPLPLGQFDGTNFNFLSPNTQSFSASSLFGGEQLFADVSGTFTLTQVQTSGNSATLIGDAKVTNAFAINDSPNDVQFSFGILPGSTGDFSLSISNNSPNTGTLFGLSGEPAGTGQTWSILNGQITDLTPAPNEIPLHPAIYLFRSVLGGAFRLGRRKRSAVSGLGSA
jgi:hypothetical protein